LEFKEWDNGLNTYRVLELILGDDVSPLAWTLSYKVVYALLGRGNWTDELRFASQAHLFEAIKTWLDYCKRDDQKRLLTMHHLAKSGVSYLELIGTKTFEIVDTNTKDKVLDVQLRMAQEAVSLANKGYERTIDALFNEPWGAGEKGLSGLIREEWGKYLKFLFSSSVRCQALDAVCGSHFSHNDPPKIDDLVGFADFRPRASIAPLAMALLKPPSAFGVERKEGGKSSFPLKEFEIILGCYAEPFGMIADHCPYRRSGQKLVGRLASESPDWMNWMSSFYTMHDAAEDSGSRCAQACVVMACGLLSNEWTTGKKDDVARIPGTFEVSYLAEKKKHLGKMWTAPEDFDSWEFDSTVGLAIEEVQGVLNDTDCNVTAFRHVFWSQTANQRLLAYYQSERLLEAYISAGFPVIMFCDAREFQVPDFLGQGLSEETAHCVLVNGFRRRRTDDNVFEKALERFGKEEIEELGEQLTHLVIHDPGSAPFLAIPTKRMFKAAEKFDTAPQEGSQRNDNKINFVSVTRKSIKADPECLFHSSVPDHKTLLAIQTSKDDIKIVLMKDAEELNEKVFPPSAFPLGDQYTSNEYLERIQKLVREYVTTPVWVLLLLDRYGMIKHAYLQNAQQELQKEQWASQKDRDWGKESGQVAIVPNINCPKTIEEQLEAIAEQFQRFQVPVPPNAEGKQLSFQAGTAGTQQSEQLKFNLNPSVLTSSSPKCFSDLTQELSQWKRANTSPERSPAVDVFLLRTRDILDILDTGDNIQIDPLSIRDLEKVLADKFIPRHRFVPPGVSGKEHARLFDIGTTPHTIIKDLQQNSDKGREYLKLLLKRGYVSAIDVFAFETESGENPNLEAIKTWIEARLNGLKVSAFATYFPQIAYARLASQVARALKNCMKLGMLMRNSGSVPGNVVIEVVGGSFLDHSFLERIAKSRVGKDVVRVRHREHICNLVSRVLVRAFQAAGANESCTFAMELEPGHCYLVNDLPAIQIFLTSAEREETEAGTHSNAISLNLDIGHFRAAGIKPSDIDEVEAKLGIQIWKRFSHSHISHIDGERQHYRDLPFDKDCLKDKFVVEYIRRYSEEFDKRKNGEEGDCPISGAISVELEGAEHFSWIKTSLETLFSVKK